MSVWGPSLVQFALSLSIFWAQLSHGDFVTVAVWGRRENLEEEEEEIERELEPKKNERESFFFGKIMFVAQTLSNVRASE